MILCDEVADQSLFSRNYNASTTLRQPARCSSRCVWPITFQSRDSGGLGSLLQDDVQGFGAGVSDGVGVGGTGSEGGVALRLG
jgi:hypothetical protein